MPDGFNWSRDARGTALVRAIDAVLDDLPDLQQDRVKVELENLVTLADSDGLTSAEQVCASQGISLEGYEGVQDILLFLAVEHPSIIDRVASKYSLMQRTGGRQWSAYQYDETIKDWALDSQTAREAYLEDAIKILKLPSHRKRDADWYTTLEIDPVSGEGRDITQATIYVEERAQSEIAFKGDALERRIVPKVLELGIVCSEKDRLVEIYAKGGKTVRDEFAKAFSEHFAPDAAPPEETPRREVKLERLKTKTVFEIEPADGVETVELSSLDFWSSGGGFARFERRGQDEDIYQFLDRRFGPHSPLRGSGWNIASATIRIVKEASDGKRKKTLTATLRTPNKTSLPNATQADRQFVQRLLERWHLLAPQDDGFDVIEAA